MERQCDLCATPYEAQRANSRFCGKRCANRVGKQTKRAAEVVALQPAAPPALVGEFSVLNAVVSELQAAGRLDTVAGQAAIRVAQSLDNPGESGAAKASLARQLAATMATALENSSAHVDPLDELVARRAKRLGN